MEEKVETSWDGGKKLVTLSSKDFGPLWKYVDDDQITDIDYNGRQVWIRNVNNVRKLISGLQLTEPFVNQLIQKISNVVSKPFNPVENLLEAETEKLRISVIHESVTTTGTSICIRKTLPKSRINAVNAIENEYCTAEMLHLLANCVKAKLNIVFCGETGVGKTECAKYFSKFISKNERVITIEDNPELRYAELNPDKDCVAMKICEHLDYTKAIKLSLRQNPNWLMLSEARSSEVKYLIEGWSTGTKGFTTLHTDDVRNIPDRILNMMENRNDADRLENDVYRSVDIGVLIRIKKNEGGGYRRCIDQICYFEREGGRNQQYMIAGDGQLKSEDLPDNLLKRFEKKYIESPFENENIRRELRAGGRI